MTKFLIFFVFFLLTHFLNGQKGPEILNPDDILAIQVSIEKKPEEMINLNQINKIEWVDLQSDSFAIGLGVHINFMSKKTPYRLTPKGSLISFLNDAVQSFASLDSSGRYSARIYIQNLWLHRAGDFGTSRNRSDTLIRNDRLWLKGDIFLKDDNHFFALYRIDTTIVLRKKMPGIDPTNRRIDDATGVHFEAGTKKQLSTTTGEGISFLLKKLARIDAGSIVSRKTPISEKELDEYYKKINQHKILTQYPAKSGIFRTFETFKNAETENIEFRMHTERKVQHIEIKNRNTGKWEIERNIFGYYDGEKLYIKSGEMYFPLLKIQNSFYYWGSQEITKFVHDPMFQSLPGLMSVHEFRPLKLDVATGKILE
jgi:hypothetical protein